ncbi:hypothetical protein AB4Z42_19540 [Mycobacterium sp. 2YAF39]|uniref:hypothetical protein n=1 Tax=Mycobacterium sp. 2YAF39 TaxID=3233033 RepID=UPI003F9BCD2F
MARGNLPDGGRIVPARVDRPDVLRQKIKGPESALTLLYPIMFGQLLEVLRR